MGWDYANDISHAIDRHGVAWVLRQVAKICAKRERESWRKKKAALRKMGMKV